MALHSHTLLETNKRSVKRRWSVGDLAERGHTVTVGDKVSFVLQLMAFGIVLAAASRYALLFGLYGVTKV